MAATAFSNVTTTILVLNLLISTNPTAATWCVAKTDAAADALQKALDYACGAGADCEPLQEAGLCFTPNTVEAHASYAFNSYYMHSSMDPVACNFAGTATIVKTDPSYGSCVYPASPRHGGASTTKWCTTTNGREWRRITTTTRGRYTAWEWRSGNSDRHGISDGQFTFWSFYKVSGLAVVDYGNDVYGFLYNVRTNGYLCGITCNA